MFVGVLLTVAMLYDITKYKVPNWCIYIGLLTAVGYQCYGKGVHGLFGCLLDVGIIFLIMFPFSLLGMFGAGDVKIFMVIGGFFGCRFTLSLSFIALVIGAMCSLGKMLWHHNLLYRLRILASYFYIIIAGRKIIKYAKEETTSKENVIPFLVPIWFAYGIAQFFPELF